jgi:hypothetical protein
MEYDGMINLDGKHQCHLYMQYVPKQKGGGRGGFGNVASITTPIANNYL